MITDFIFDGQELSGFGYMICDFDSSSGTETSSVSDMSFTDIKSPLSNISHNIATSYTENLSRTIQIMKNPCDNNNLNITNDDLSELSRWLCRKDYKLFKWVDDEDDDEVFYEVQIKLRKIELGNGRVGVELDIISNRPFGLTREIINTMSLYVAPPPSENDTFKKEYFITDELYENSSYQKYLYVHDDSYNGGTFQAYYTYYVPNSARIALYKIGTQYPVYCTSDTFIVCSRRVYYNYDGSVKSTSDNMATTVSSHTIALGSGTTLYNSFYIFDNTTEIQEYLNTGDTEGAIVIPDNSNSNLTNFKKITVFSDDEGYIYPDVTITIQADGDLELVNEFENRTTYIAGCTVGEVITIIGGDTLQITSSDDTHDMSKCFNYKFPRLCTEYMNYTNTFSTNITCDIEIKYRGIRKVGI